MLGGRGGGGAALTLSSSSVPPNTGGVVATARARLAGAVSWSVLAGSGSGVSVNATTGAISLATGLAAGATTIVKLRAQNGAGDAIEKGFTLTGIVQVTVPDAPALTVAAGDGKVTIGFTDGAANGAAIQQRLLYASTTSNFTVGPDTRVGAVSFPYDLTGLANGTPVFVRGSAVNAAGEGAVSTQVSATPSVGGAAPTLATPATLAGTPGGTMTWTAPTFTGATGAISAGVEADGVPVITSTNGSGTFDSSVYAGKTLKTYGFGTNASGTTASRSAGVAIALTGYLFANTGIAKSDGALASTIAGLTEIRTPNSPSEFTVNNGKISRPPNNFRPGGAIGRALSANTRFSFIVDGTGHEMDFFFAGKADGSAWLGFTAISVYSSTDFEPFLLRVVNNSIAQEYMSVGHQHQGFAIGDRLGLTQPSANIVSFSRLPAGSTTWTPLFDLDLTTVPGYAAGIWGTYAGFTGVYANTNDIQPYQGDAKIEDVVNVPLTLTSVTEDAPILYANPTSATRSMTVSGSSSGITGALEYAIRNTNTGVTSAYATLAASVSGGVFSATIKPAFSAADKSGSATMIVRSAGDTSKFAGTPFTFSNLDPAPLRMGMNLAGVNNASSEYPFLDLMKSAGPPGTQGGSQTLDANGWPTQVPAGGQSYWAIPLPTPNVSYTMLYDGSQAVGYYDANASTKNAVGINGANVDYSVPGQITFIAGSGGLNISLSHVDTSSSGRIRNIRLVRSDRLALFNAGQIFNPDFLTKLGIFYSLRLMDWAATNDSSSTVDINWADRSVPANQSWNVVPLEIQVALGNALYAAGAKTKQIWFCIPGRATDAYVTSCMTYIRDNLNPNILAAIEYSNEVWNGSFGVYNYANTKGQALNSGDAHPVQYWYGYRSAQIMAITKSVFGSAFAARVIGVQATFGEWTDATLANSQFAGIAAANVGTKNELFKYWSPATYFGDGLGVYPGNEADRPIVQGWADTYAANPVPSNLDPVFAYLNHGTGLTAKISIDDKLATWAVQAAIAKANGLEMAAYEGGLSYYYYAATDANKPNLTVMFNAVLADSRMGDLYVRLTNEFRKAGGTQLNAFNDIGTPGIFGPWPALLGLYSPDTPRWTIMSNVAALS